MNKPITINYLLIVSLTISGVHSFFDEKIASVGQFKYMVAIWYHNEYRCSGSIIGRQHVLTSALCLRDMTITHVSVTAGTIDTLNPKRDVFLVESVEIHYGLKVFLDPEMLGRHRWENDIAVLKLKHEIIWGPNLASLDIIPGEYRWANSQQCVAAGWQDTVAERSKRVFLMWIEATIVPNEECNNLGLLKNEKCVHLATDSPIALSQMNGSPLICNNYAVGIILGGRNDNPKILLNLSPYSDFIANAMDDRKNNVKEAEIRYIVTIWNLDSYVCGGTIVTDIHVLTSLHCIRPIKQDDLRVVAGYIKMLPSDERMEWLVARIDPHSEDTAILTVSYPFRESGTIGRAVYSETTDIPTWQTCKVFRWHPAYTVGKQTLMQLVWTDEAILRSRDCQTLGLNLGTHQFCATNYYSYEHSNSDNFGNPMVCDNIVIGINIPSPSPCSTMFTLSLINASQPQFLILETNEFQKRMIAV